MKFSSPILLILATTNAFSPPTVTTFRHSSTSTSTTTTSTSLFGISEWRDMMITPEFDISSSSPAAPPAVAPLGIIPMLSKDVILPGQVRYLQLSSSEEQMMISQAKTHHANMFAMGLKMYVPPTENDETTNSLPPPMLPTMPLLEIQDTITMFQKEYGIFCKVRAVGRVRVVHGEANNDHGDSILSSPLCMEVFDTDDQFDDDDSFQRANQLTSTIEALMADMSVMERITGVLATSSLQQQQQEQLNYNRWERFQGSYEQALEWTTQQGYITTTRTTTANQSSSSSSTKSWPEMAAMAWASYSTSPDESSDATMRLNAMHMTTIIERLEFAMYWLTDVREQVEQRIMSQEE